NFLNKRRPGPEYDEDFFRDTRMSFGDHLEELRTRMWRAIKGLGLFLVIGFVLDGIGDRGGLPWLGIGKAMVKVIVDPVEQQVKEFYRERNEATRKRLDEARQQGGDQRITRVIEMPGSFRTDQFPGQPGTVELKGTFVLSETEVYLASAQGQQDSDAEKYLKGLGIMEAFMVYFKMSLLCGFILACPWIFYQMWAFIGAGLYPHGKKVGN